jgi:hypothetical protein
MSAAEAATKSTWTICEETKPPSPKLAPPRPAARGRQPLRHSSTKAPVAAAPSVSASARTQAPRCGKKANSNVVGKRAWAFAPASRGVPAHK